MPEETTSSSGIFGALRRLVETLLAIIQNRIELVTVEIQEEKARAVAIAIWSALLIAAAFMAMITITFLLVVAFWDQAFWVLLGFSIFYLVGGLVSLLMIRSRLKAPLFPETINQIRKDRQWLFSPK